MSLIATLATAGVLHLLTLSMLPPTVGAPVESEDPASVEPAAAEGEADESAEAARDDRAPSLAIASAPTAPTTATLPEGEPGEVFVEANRWYEGGDYARAAEAYQSLIDRGLGSAAVQYNLGNALLRDGRLGAAIAAYRRAKVLSPRDEDLDANLRFARASARDALEPPAPGAIRRTLFFWHYSLSPSETIRLGVLANLLLFGSLAFLLRRKGSEPLRWLAVVAGVVLVAATLSLVSRWALPLRVAVVLPAEVEAFSGTDADTVVRFRLHAGTEVRAAEIDGSWVRIILPEGEQGWVERAQVELVTDLR